MSAHVPHRQHQLSPAEWALVSLLAVAVVTAGGWLWAVFAAPVEMRTLVAVGGGVAGIMLSGATAVATYYAVTARQSREQSMWLDARAARLEQELLHLSGEVLPALGKSIRAGEPVETALARMPQPTHEALQRLVSAMAWELGESERRGASAMATHSAMENEATSVLNETLPTLVKRIRTDRTSAGSALAEVSRPTNEALQGLVNAMARELGESERKGASAMAACASAAARVQAQVTTLLARLRELEEQYGDQEEIFPDLLDLDHRVSQMGRLADSFALLSGGRSGRRWTKPIVMESILRGAMGRISAYRRVRVHSTSTIAVAGYAAEGVMHTLAELMDNATTFSAHGTEVHVYIEEEDTGVMVRVEDSGLGMRARERRRAEKLISEPLDLTSLSGTRLGLAVVGRLASKYGLTVNFRPSSRGGTGVVVLIPHQLITQSRQETGETTQLAVEGPSPEEEPAAPEAAATRTGDGDWDALPKRRRGETLAAASRSMPPRSAEPMRARRDPGARFAAFHQAGGRGSPSQAEEESR